MKQKKVLTMLIVLVFGLGQIASSQSRNNQGNISNCPKGNTIEDKIPDLTDAQKEKIETLRLKHQKETIQAQNKIQEKMARIKTLSNEETVDLKAIETAIDEKQKLEKEMVLSHLKHREEIRNLLTDKQKEYFDAMPHHNYGHGYSKGYNRQGCQGNGPCKR